MPFFDAIPKLVYHYTSMANLLNIVQSRQLWATHISYLNDVLERQVFFEAVIKHGKPFSISRGIDHDVLSDMLKTRPSYEGIARLPFVISFTRHKDSLPQWRSYCGQGNGVSIGFDSARLKRNTVARENAEELKATNQIFSPITYLDVFDRVTLEKILSNSLSRAVITPGVISDAVSAATLERFVEKLGNRASFIKHTSFESEGEYRLLVSNVNLNAKPSILSARATKTTLVPFVKIDLTEGAELDEPLLPIKEIVIGPCPNPDLSLQALRLFAEAHGFKVKLSKSESPFRDL